MHGHPDFPPVYKYSQREHVVNLTRFVKIRVGTLYGYRDIEEHQAGTGDPDEGRMKLVEKEVERWTKDTSAPLARMAFNIPPGTVPRRDDVFTQNTISLQYETQNLWLYCTSGTLMSLETASTAMRSEYDAVAVIHDPHCFSLALVRALHRESFIVDAGFYWVEYGERVRPSDQRNAIDPALVKPTKHAGQDECRFVSVPREPITQKYINLEVPELVPFCRMLGKEDIPT